MPSLIYFISHAGNSSGNEGGFAEPVVVPISNRGGLRDRKVRSQVSLAAPVVTVPNAGRDSSSGARSKRRRAVDDDLDSMFNPTVLEDLLNSMMRHRDGWPFDRPITKADAPDYHKIVTRPMDLGTIRSSLNRMKFTCNQEVNYMLLTCHIEKYYLHSLIFRNFAGIVNHVFSKTRMGKK